eukprot:TRINITY_DN8089_c0_g1_i1.p1 TRINITY_DN8089_c0_g1~~TRINITY_DN8089_c0_g1_i1.p1  ORF type:complete len:402 (+),score=86.14 TRINITY_DN8089_c0_g1_i1:105-1310(+)
MKKKAFYYKTMIDNMNEKIFKCSVKRKYHTFTYNHYYLTDGQFVIEFDGNDIHQDAQITVSMAIKYTGCDYSVPYTFTQEMKNRAKMIVGATSYSLMLRNCEHTVNYIIDGYWLSDQTNTSGIINDIFKNYLMNENQQKLNTRPDDLKKPFEPKEAPFRKDIPTLFRFVNSTSTVQHNEKDFNIVVVGPTGVGKSNFINLISNQEIVESVSQPQSVTKDIIVNKGKFLVKGGKSGHFVDTVGLCDSHLSWMEVVNMIKNAIKNKLMHVDLFIFFLPKRITQENRKSMEEILKWLNYQNISQKQLLNFLFLVNQTGSDSEEEKTNFIQGLSEDALKFKILTNIEEEEYKLVYCIDTKLNSEKMNECINIFKERIELLMDLKLQGKIVPITFSSCLEKLFNLN